MLIERYATLSAVKTPVYRRGFSERRKVSGETRRKTRAIQSPRLRR